MGSANIPPGYDDADCERLVREPIKETVRSAFARDRARVLHSVGLRRLAAKTQVMATGRHDFPRTRLTHTLEVAQIGRELGAALGCDPDLVEVAGLTHDLGHPPFGHNGEDELNQLTLAIGGFEGNAQTIRVLSRLEAKVLDAEGKSVGLNLSRASLDASCKYPWSRIEGERKYGYYADDAHVFHWFRQGAPERTTCLEEQVMDWADDVAYSVHDLEDAIHGGLVDVTAMTSPSEIADLVAIAHERYAPTMDVHVLEAAINRLVDLDYWPRSFDGSLVDLVALKHFTSSLIGRFSVSAQIATQIAFGDQPLTRYDASLVVPEEVRAEVAVMKAFAVKYVMNRPGADAEYSRQREIIAEVVHGLRLDEGRSLEPWLRLSFDAAQSDAERFRVVIDQVASLTDTSIMAWHARLTR